MKTSQPQTVFVILTGAVAPAGLARAAIRNGWPVLNGPIDRGQLEQAVNRGRSSVVIVHVPAAHDRVLDMIRGFRSSCRNAVVIAVGVAASEEVEIQARVAGAGLFLPDNADADQIERTVLALFVPTSHAARTPPLITDRPMQSYRRSVG